MSTIAAPVSPAPADAAEESFEDISLAKVESLERQLASLTDRAAATAEALAASKAALSHLQVLLDGARLEDDAASARYSDARNAAASVHGAIRVSDAAFNRGIDIRESVLALLTDAHEAAERVLVAAEAVDELVAEVATYGKNHYLPAALVDGVDKADRFRASLVAATIECVEAAMAAYVEACHAQVAAEATRRQGLEVWEQLDASSDPLAVKGVSRLKLGMPDIDCLTKLVRAMSSGTYARGVLHILADTREALRLRSVELEAGVNQSRLEVNSLEQRLADQRAMLRATQLALDGVRATLGTRF